MDGTGASGLRERNVEARRQRILGAARSLLAKGGLQALSMRKLAEEASLSVNTLYNLWGTREEILRAMTLDARDRIQAQLPNDSLPADPIELCRKLVHFSVQAMIGEKEVFRPMILAWLESEIAGRSSPVEPMAESIETLSQVIRAGRKQGLFEGPMRPEQIAWQIHHGAQFAAVQWALRGIDDEHFEARVLYGMNLAFLGLVPDERKAELRSQLKALERKLRAPDPPAS